MYFKDRLDDISERINLRELIVPAIIIFVFIIGIILIIIGNRGGISYNNKVYYIDLLGKKEMTIYVGSEYIEPGYRASNGKGENLTDRVVVDNQVNTNLVGEYNIRYILDDTSVTRTVKVTEKPVGATYIFLYGDLIMYLNAGEEYVEPGYEVVDTVDGGKLKENVTIDSNVNIKKAGAYKITYSVINSSGITTSKQRTVIVMDSDISLTLDNENYTNGNITINYHVNDSHYAYTILPNNERITDFSYAYKVTENGEYKFLVYNQKGSYKEAIVTIDNIDRTKPSGSCSGSYKNGVSTINVSASDDHGIGKYVVNNVTYTTNPITINSELDNVLVTIYDKAGNQAQTSCNLTDNNPIDINGSCSGSFKNGTSTINIKATSSRGIAKYVINGNSYTTSTINLKGELSKVTVVVYDKKNNTKTISCTLEDHNVSADPTNISTKKPIKKSDNVYLGYYKNFSFWIYFPDKMKANLPVILFMGGLGERGDDYNSGGSNAINLGPIQDVFEFNIKPNAIIIHAQCPGGQTVYGYLSSYVDLLNKVVAEYKANAKKVSVMGISHGCYGIMNLIPNYQHYFSAAVPIGCNPGNRASYFVSTPTWAFAGGGDGVSTMPGFADEINRLGGNAKFTRPPLHEHNVLRLDYSILRDDNYKVIDWMISQTRS